jgi:thiosulfate/3-mercaptopyruvate sulfurtransferase
MKAKIFSVGLGSILLFFVMLSPLSVLSQDISPIISTEWLEKNMSRPGLVILDIRRVEDFREGHVPGAVNLFYRAWAFKKDHLYAEIPDLDDLFDMIGSAGIKLGTPVVVIGQTKTLPELVHGARVACTLKYAGVKDVSILDGGYDKWAHEGRKITTVIKKVKTSVFKGKINSSLFADKQYIVSRWGKILLLDVRETEYYSGKKKMDCVERPGKIPGALNLPTSMVFTSEGTFAEEKYLRSLAEGVAGKDRDRELVTYCDTGQCCPTWALILKEVLGYRQVRIYDGGLQEWMSDPNVPQE